MKKTIITCVALLLCVSLFCTAAAATNESPAKRAEKYICSVAGCKTGELLAQSKWLQAGTSGNDWLAFVLAINDIPEKKNAYLSEMENYVTEQYAEKGCLHKVLATEYHRIALTVLALGGDPTSFGKDANGDPVNLIADGTWGFGENLSKQGLNGLIYALIALDSKAFPVPDDAVIDREWILTQILAAQNEDGGFGFIKGSSDVDLSAMTLTALAPYKASYSGEIGKALEFLSCQQSESGQYACFGNKNAESAAQVIIALCSLGIDPETDERFIKNGQTLLDTLQQFRLEDGAYCHILDGEWDLIATEQALLALTAIDRLRAGEPGIYDFTKATPKTSDNGVQIKEILVAAAAVVVIAAVAAVVAKTKKRGRVHADDHQ